jgi:hypothetical protein
VKQAAAIFALSLLLASQAMAQLQTLPAPAGSSVAVAKAELKAAGQPCKKVVAAHRLGNGAVDAVCAIGGAKRERYLIFRARGIDHVFALRCVAAKRLVNVSCDDDSKGVNKPDSRSRPHSSKHTRQFVEVAGMLPESTRLAKR